jgi:hypothetical protein
MPTKKKSSAKSSSAKSSDTMSDKEAPCRPNEYALHGPQVEPQASYWMFCSRLHIVTIDELRARTEDMGSRDFFPPYPDPCTAEGRQEIKREIDELIFLQERRDEPCSLVDEKTCTGETKPPCRFEKKLPRAFQCRRPISKLLNLMPPALGAVMVNRLPGEQIIRTGRGLARAFESETPGISYRHALNYLMRTRNWSPPRQALIWAALDVALASALQAAWYYKWLSPRPLTSRRERPIEYAHREGIPLRVLFDLPDELNPAYNLCPDGRIICDPKNANNFSGTPRHPAYPSGHSTYSGAATEFLRYFFSNDPTPPFLLPHPELGSKPNTTIGQELDLMGENIGQARLWAGVHWRSDHEAGNKLGRTVACLVIKQLNDMGALDDPFILCPKEPKRPANQCDCSKHQEPCDMSIDPSKPSSGLTRDQLQVKADKWRADCGKDKPTQEPCPAPPKELHLSLDDNRGTQQGAQ